MSKKGGKKSTRESRVAEPVVAAATVKVSASLLFFLSILFGFTVPGVLPPEWCQPNTPTVVFQISEISLRGNMTGRRR